MLWKVFCYIFFRDFATKFAPPPWGKMAVTPLTGVTDSWFFFIRKIFVHRIGLKVVLAKKNVLKWRECKSYDFFSFFVTQCHSNLYKMGKNVLKSTFLVLSVKRRAISNRINLNIGCRWYTTRATDLWKGPIFQFWPYFLGRKNAKKKFFFPFFIFMYKNTLLTKISII